MNRSLRLLLLVQLTVCLMSVVGCGGEESKNECEDAKEVRMQAIGENCSNYIDCCYCSCELSLPLGAGCDCTAWGVLNRDTDTSVCQGGDLNNAVNCVSNTAACSSNIGAIITQRCR